jgi:hypothetical protein
MVDTKKNPHQVRYNFLFWTLCNPWHDCNWSCDQYILNAKKNLHQTRYNFLFGILCNPWHIAIDHVTRIFSMPRKICIRWGIISFLGHYVIHYTFTVGHVTSISLMPRKICIRWGIISFLEISVTDVSQCAIPGGFRSLRRNPSKQSSHRFRKFRGKKSKKKFPELEFTVWSTLKKIIPESGNSGGNPLFRLDSGRNMWGSVKCSPPLAFVLAYGGRAPLLCWWLFRCVPFFWIGGMSFHPEGP